MDDRSARPLVPPIQLSTVFERTPQGDYPEGFSYTRSGNPNRAALESELARLECGAEAAAFASGLAASHAVFQTLKSGDHALIPREAYWGLRAMLEEIFPRWGLTATAVDMTSPEAVRAALRPTTRLVWVETPSNPTMRVTDLAAVSQLAKAAGALLVCDNTVATPALQQPLALGVDWIVHSTTKYLNGHSDVLGGAVVARTADAAFARLRSVQNLGGAVPSPFDCWLTLRSLKTFPLRVAAQSATALAVAEFLASHPRVTVVHYPGLTRHPDHALARRQMRGFGGLLSFEVTGGAAEAIAVLNACRVIRRATSLGGSESSMEQRRSVEGPTSTTPPALLRLSIGLEPAADLTADLAQALGQVFG